MRQHRLAAGGLGDDRFGKSVVAAQERGDATRIVGFLVGGEQEGGIALGDIRRRDQSCSRTLDVADAQADYAIIEAAHHMRIGRPRLRRGHGVEVHVEHPTRVATHGEQRDRTVAVVADLDAETRQLRADVVEDPASADQARRVAGVEGHQRFEVG